MEICLVGGRMIEGRFDQGMEMEMELDLVTR